MTRQVLVRMQIGINVLAAVLVIGLLLAGEIRIVLMLAAVYAVLFVIIGAWLISVRRSRRRNPPTAN